MSKLTDGGMTLTIIAKHYFGTKPVPKCEIKEF